MEVEIYENVIGIHTFELRMRLSSFSEYKEYVAQLFNEERNIVNETGECVHQNHGVVNGEGICDNRTHGIRLYIEKNEFVWLKLIVSPRNLIGDGNPYGVCRLSKEDIELLNKKIDEFLFLRGLPYYSHQFLLSRVDLCTNILSNDKLFPQTMIRLLNRTPLKGAYKRIAFSPAALEYGNDAYEKNTYSYMAAIQKKAIKIYDKLSEKGAVPFKQQIDPEKSLLRIEVTLKREEVLKWITENSLENQTALQVVQLFSDKALSLICGSLEKVFPHGDYVKRDEAQKRIKESGFIERIQSDMLETLDLIHRSKSPSTIPTRIKTNVLGVYNHPKRKYQELMDRFDKLGFQPTLLSKKDPDSFFSPSTWLKMACLNSADKRLKGDVKDVKT